MTTARDYLAAVQQRADAATPQAVRDEPWIAQALAADSTVLAAAFTEVLDLHKAYVSCGNPQHTNFEVECPECADYCEACGEVYPCPTFAVITDALTPKENDS
jgi:hypothetical protein